MFRGRMTALSAALCLFTGSAWAFEIEPTAWATGDWIEATVFDSPIAAPDSIDLVGPGGVVIHASQIASSGERITFLLDLRQAPTGWYDLRLATISGDAHTEAQCFETLPLALPEAWSEQQRLTDEPETSDRPGIAVDRDGQVHVVWQNLQSGQNDRFNILYRRWTGTAWTDTEILTAGG